MERRGAWQFPYVPLRVGDVFPQASKEATKKKTWQQRFGNVSFPPPSAFQRTDQNPDTVFYEAPRINIHHIDEFAQQALCKYYAQQLRSLNPKASVLDLMSSWTSHLPSGLDLGRLVGLGLNADELAANPLLTDRIVFDLNSLNENLTNDNQDREGSNVVQSMPTEKHKKTQKETQKETETETETESNREKHNHHNNNLESSAESKLPFEDNSFDAVLCSLSVDYLVKPLVVFREINRVLKPNGLCIMAFSNRCFPSKAIQLWLEAEDNQRVWLVGAYFHFAGGFTMPESIDLSSCETNNVSKKKQTDPLYVVQARKLPATST
jgi:SAM-dependent methyltransferase